MQPQISQPIPSAFYYKTGITNPTFSKGYDVFFEETSNINFNNLFEFLKLLPLDFFAIKKLSHKTNIKEKPINIDLFALGIKIFKIKIFDMFAKIKILDLCNLITINSFQISMKLYKNYLIFHHDFNTIQNLKQITPRFHANHPYIKILKLIYKYSSLQVIKPFIEQQVFCSKTRSNHENKNKFHNTDDIIDTIGGNFQISFFTRDITNKCLFFQNKPIQHLIWVAPWAHGFLKTHTYFQIDASFKALYPYVYFIPLLIINNAAIPLGISLGPSERSTLFSNFFMFVKKLYNDFDISNYAFLSDQGKAIEKFVEGYGIKHNHNLCFRQILESLGSGSPVAVLARRLLFKCTMQDYEAALPQTLCDLLCLKNNNMITDQQIEKFLKIFNFQFENGEIVQLSNTTYINSLWYRVPYGISTCSNHLERLHRTLNFLTTKEKNIHQRLYIILQELFNYFYNFPKKSRTQAKKMLKHMLKASKNPNNCIIQKENCQCGWSEIFSIRYGIENFPCIHNISFKANELNIIDLPNINPEEIDQSNGVYFEE